MPCSTRTSTPTISSASTTSACFTYYLGHKLPLYCEAAGRGADPQVVRLRLRRRRGELGGASVPHLDDSAASALEPFRLAWGRRVMPMRLYHGRFRVLGFRFGNIAYCTDVNGIPDESVAAVGRARRADPRRPAAEISSDALQPARKRSKTAQTRRREADLLHAHGARARTRTDERRVARRHGTWRTTDCRLTLT